MPSFPTQRKRKRKTFEKRKNRNRKIYNSARWRKLRSWYIQNNPLCEECIKFDIITDATGRKGVIDHKNPINQGGDPFDPNNLQTLCNKCHNIKSGKEAHEKGNNTHYNR